MRIISKDRDYYDCVQKEGQDLTCVWLRKLEQVYYDKKRVMMRRPKDAWPFPVCYDARGEYLRDINLIEYIVGFCGKIYPVLRIDDKRYGKPTTPFCHSIEDIDSYIKANFTDKQFSLYEGNARKKNRKDLGIYRKNLVKFFDECKVEKEKFSSIFVDNKCPVFLARMSCWHCELSHIVYHGRLCDQKGDEPKGLALLKDVEFYKMFPTQQAFQEIWQYLGGVLGGNSPTIPEIDDNTMRDAKGFDKFSFRKDKKKGRVK